VADIAAPDPLADTGAEGSEPEDPLEQLAKTTVRATNIPAAGRIGTVCRCRLKTFCAVSRVGRSAQEIAYRDDLVTAGADADSRDRSPDHVLQRRYVSARGTR
jgi:hypothetical protein